MNILLITQTLASGGAERSISKLSGLFSLSHQVVILVINDKKKIDFEYSGKLVFLKDFKTNNIFPFFNKVQAIKKIKRIHNIDVSISFLEGPNFSNILSRTKDKVCVSVRGHKSSLYKKEKRKWLIEKLAVRLLYNFSDGVVAASKGIAEDLYQNLGVKQSKIKVIPNFYNSDEILAKSKESVGDYDCILNSNPVLVTTGRLSVPKGHDHLLEIYHRLKQMHGDLKLLILGDGELYDYFLKYASNYNLKVYTWREKGRPDSSFDVFLAGFVPNPFAYISKSTLFVFTSLWEGFPNALAEAIICGTPVVSSDCLSGPRELLFDDLSYKEKVHYPLTSKYGLLLPSFDLENMNFEDTYKVWVEVLNSVLNDYKSGRGNVDSSCFSRKFSEDAISRLWSELIH